MKKRRYADLYDYTLDEFDRWLEKGINKKLRSAQKAQVRARQAHCLCGL
jgi:hypothetical protein